LAIACIYYVRLEKWPFACLLGMLASLTRITGLSLLPALVFEYFSQRKRRKLKNLDIGFV
jgi:Gpi18-like mannosyltransferase